MATYRVMIQVPYPSGLARDAVTINPHFNGDNPSALANALKTNLINQPAISTKPFTIKVYDALAAPPNYPLATAEQIGTAVAGGIPREVAICCSYYTTYNRPRYRGRLYFPAWWFTSNPSERPTQAIQDNVIAFAKAAFASGLPAAHNWVVFSATERKSMGGVSSVWCDDEWDTVRSRGLRATNRRTATVP